MRAALCLAVLACLIPYRVVQGQINPVPLAPANYFDDDTITFVYDPKGEFFLAHPIDDGGSDSNTPELVILEVISSEDFFIGPNPFFGCNIGLFCVWNPKKLFYLDPSGFTSLPFNEPPQAAPGLGAEALSEALTVNGTFVGGGELTSFDLYVVSEPSSFAVIGIGLLALMHYRQRRGHESLSTR